MPNLRPATPSMIKAFTSEMLRQSLARVMPKVEAAYSMDRYNSWEQVAKTLLKHGLDERQTEAVMCSKWTRWAADASGQRYGSVSAKVVLDFVKKQGNDEVVKLTLEHFGN